MFRQVLFAKIHGATTTAAKPEYVGSVTIDADLLEACGMRPSDHVMVANCRNGERFETYILWGEPGSRKIEVNGAAAHLVEPGDKLIIMHFAHMTDEEYRNHHPKILVMRPDNSVERVQRHEPR